MKEIVIRCKTDREVGADGKYIEVLIDGKQLQDLYDFSLNFNTHDSEPSFNASIFSQLKTKNINSKHSKSGVHFSTRNSFPGTKQTFTILC